MAATTIFYRSITLQPGEQFTLPPNAELIGATNSGALESTCTIPELEDLACYVASLATLSNAQTGSDTVFWGHDTGVAPGAAKIAGYSLSGTKTYFVGDYRNDDPGAFLDMRFSASTIASVVAEMITNGLGIVASATGVEPGDGDNGTITYFLIKTIPSIANNLKLLYRSSAPGTGTVEYEVPFVPIADVVAGDNSTIPACP